ncbi:MAG: hypothetical protein IAE77_25225 [Prosthecobacter sp.]|jgi:cell division protein FtsB|uniref:hypothetical protein n=1 Tax=Prosthecobacter sp. TaxID=1965333 RepID=UPI0019E907D2|nr:hypothetical protein [Prosthecobacter sp.]MBE2286784.1 hypothetical protein [Prosthecobacter sp.]
MFKDLLSPTNTFIYGFVLCGIFLVQSLWAHWKTKRELKRYKGMLSDKLDLDSKQNQDLNKERATLKQENENLRMQIARLNERPDNKMQRELEILARAEKQMVISAPGFAPAWEMAKSAALGQLESEEKGQSFPQKVFRKLIGSGSAQTNVALPESAAAAAKGGNGTTAAAAM